MINKSKVHYMNDLPFDIYGVEVVRMPLHYQKDIKIIYVVEGTLSLEKGPCKYFLNAGDIFVINDHDLHSINGTGNPNMTILLHLSRDFFSRYFKNMSHCFFVSYEGSEVNPSMENLRKIIAALYSEFNRGHDGYRERCIGLCNNILDFLYDECQFFKYENGIFINNSSVKSTQKKKKRMRELISFLYANYESPISLKDLSQNYQLSTYYLSHAVKAATGLSFQELLGYIRVEKSQLMLINNNESVPAIAKLVGFTTTEYYRKHFKFWYGKTPEDYRSEFLLSSDKYYYGLSTKLLSSAALLTAIGKYLSYSSDIIHDAVKQRCQFVNLDMQNYIPVKVKRLLPVLSCPFSTIINHYEEVVMALKDLDAKNLVITSSNGSPAIGEEIEKLRDMGISLSYEPSKTIENRGNYTFDTSYMACRIFNTDSINLQLFDEPAKTRRPIAGKNGLITSLGVKKSSFYAYKLLAKLKGEITHKGENYIISRSRENENTNIWVAAYNNNMEIKNFPKCDSANEAHNFELSYSSESEILFHFQSVKGVYRITRYLLSGEHSIISALTRGSYIHEKKPTAFPPIDYMNWFTAPKTDTTIVNAQDSMSIHVKLKGYSCELIRIESIESV